jgi:3-oxoacyl-[acyl-carrier protein] reductase
MARLEGKVALITGAGSGFGEAMAHGFVAQGAHVIVADISIEGGKRVVQEIMDKKYSGGGSAAFLEFNVTNRNAWEKGLAFAEEKYGKLDIVVNNAGTTYKKQPSVEVSEADFDKIIAVNVKGIYLSVSVIMPYFLKRKYGVYLNTSSVAGTRVRPGQVFYGGTKGFLNTVCFLPNNFSNTALLTKHFVLDYARSGSRVRPVRNPREFSMSLAGCNRTPRDVQWSRRYPRRERAFRFICAVEAYDRTK